MITDFFLNLIAQFFTWFIEFIDDQVPESMDAGINSLGSGASAFAEIVYHIQSVGVWLPLSFLVNMVVLVWSVKFLGFTVVVIRKILSLFTGGGGA